MNEGLKMNTLQYFKQLRSIVNKASIILRILRDEQFEAERLSGELLRNVHSIEKGLSLRSVRSCFGLLKINEAGTIANRLLDINQDEYKEEVMMFIDSLKAYLDYHKNSNIVDSRLEQVLNLTHELSNRLNISESSESIGGYKFVQLREHTREEYELLSQIIHSRHSIREFSGEPVPIDKILESIDLARYCPSACNRQAFGIHIVFKDMMSIFQNWFDGVGGFSNELDKLLLITAKISSYRADEEMQYIVSSAVLSGYLTLTLEANNIGCCYIQRPVLPTEQWKIISKKLEIPQDEQIICALGIGMKSSSYKIPISNRININRIVSLHDVKHENI